MSFNVLVTITGSTSLGPFQIAECTGYSEEGCTGCTDITNPSGVGITVNELTNGHYVNVTNDNTTSIQLTSSGTCDNVICLLIDGKPTLPPTPTPTITSTPTPTSTTIVDTPTPTPTGTPTVTPTSTPTVTPTPTPTVTSTPTVTPTSTPTSTPTNTPTSTPIPLRIDYLVYLNGGVSPGSFSISVNGFTISDTVINANNSGYIDVAYGSTITVYLYAPAGDTSSGYPIQFYTYISANDITGYVATSPPPTTNSFTSIEFTAISDTSIVAEGSVSSNGQGPIIN